MLCYGHKYSCIYIEIGFINKQEKCYFLELNKLEFDGGKFSREIIDERDWGSLGDNSPNYYFKVKKQLAYICSDNQNRVYMPQIEIMS